MTNQMVTSEIRKLRKIVIFLISRVYYSTTFSYHGWQIAFSLVGCLLYRKISQRGNFVIFIVKLYINAEI